MGIPGAEKIQARLGRYELLAKLATGGMGEIFLARLSGAEGFEKLYVVKRILPHLADDARFRQMLIAEARIAAKMAHANICQVYELGETDGQLYIVMEYLEGVSLLPLLRRSSKASSPLDFGFVAGVLQQTCEALNYAHELKDRGGEYLGLVHRDVTPSNVFLTDSGVTKVLDFGIAKAKGASTNTQEGTVKGKYAYMAPEQLRGASIDRRVDIFALGVVAYEMLALRRLFQRKTDYLTFRAVMEQPIPDVRRYRPDTPEGLAIALARALDRDPGNRYETARQFGSAILDAIDGIRRPWTQGEIGDFVRLNFADEIGKKSQQVASVVHRTASGVNTRSTMPLIAHQENTDPDIDDDDDDGFPSVETEVEGTPPFMPPPPSKNAGATGDFMVGGTPPPFGSESTGSAPSLRPLRAASPVPPGPASQPMMVPQRNLMWPIFGVAMVAIAGGALFLVWRQMQQQQQPSVVNITQESSDRGSADKPPTPPPTHDGSNDTVGPNLPDDDVGKGSDHAVDHGHKQPKVPPQKVTYDSVMADKKSEMVQCLSDHRAEIPTEAIVAKIKIATNGKPKTVSLQPDTLNAAPLGACIRNVLITAGFPTAATDVDITVPLKPKTT